MTQNADEPPAAVERATGAPGALSGHITENIENIAAFQLREQQKVGDSQRRLGSIGDIVGRPGYLLFLLSLIVLWIAVNGLGSHFGWLLPPDPPPFAWLQGFLTLVGVLTTTVVLIAQNRRARLDSQPGHLGLQLGRPLRAWPRTRRHIRCNF